MEEQKTYSYEEGKAIFTKRMIVYFAFGIGLLSLTVLAILFLVLYDLFLGGSWAGSILAIVLFLTLTPPGLVFLAKALRNRQALKTLKMVCEPLL